MECSIARTYNRKGFSDTGATRTGGYVRYFLISSNAYWQALFQTNKTLFFVSLVNGWQRPERFDINLWI